VKKLLPIQPSSSAQFDIFFFYNFSRFVDQCIELVEEHVRVKQSKADGPEKEAHLKKLEEEHVPKLLRMFEQRLHRTGANHLLPSGLSIADLYLFHAVEWLGDRREHHLAQHPGIVRVITHVLSQPKVATYLENRPETNL
jgi:glutathione S-transferase